MVVLQVGVSKNLRPARIPKNPSQNSLKRTVLSRSTVHRVKKKLNTASPLPGNGHAAFKICHTCHRREDIIHITNLKMKNLSESVVQIYKPFDTDAASWNPHA
ncbi:hypothetical protein E2542_SST06463 [Spatholobus suberectus]|nr:hypothetical protein E2542_SST06463 [Spatholobus suberectus]